MAVKKEISLLPESENINSLSSRALHWTASVGRYIIVFTELIVIIAFISRFWLDRKSADLSEVVRQQKAILDSTALFEKDFNLVQQKLKIIKEFYGGIPQYDQKLSTLADSTPPDIVFETLSISKDLKINRIIVNASAFALKESSIVDFLTNLTVNPEISTVNIRTIEKKARENRYLINFALVFKNSNVKAASPSVSKIIDYSPTAVNSLLQGDSQ